MVTFLFWNLNKKPLEKMVANLAFGRQVDVIMLTECTIPSNVMLQTLNTKEDAQFHLSYSECKSVVIYTRFSREFIVPVREHARLTIRRLALPARTEILLAVIHFPGKLHWRNESQALECPRLADFIAGAEDQEGHTRTVLVGDLNMNPFEDGVVGASGLNAVMTKRIASKRIRTVQSGEYRFFYNPMWGRFGDATEGPPGTYYYKSSEHVTLFWNMFDQVLLRPALMGVFRNEELKILSTDGKTSFLTANEVPNACVASDHLPILFRLNL